MKLVIVESPSKSKTIEKYLGAEYKVVSSKGHIRDLDTKGKFGLGVDVENDFKPTYINIKKQSKIIKELKDFAKKSDIVYLASDPDREGEAISWHLYDVLKLDDNNSKRITFNEITKDVIIDALKHPKNIDMSLVRSQETRRILDRIIGFRLSYLMRSKTEGKSAGRVQSVALKLIVDREREINAFVKEEYWEIVANFNDFEAQLEKYHGKKIEVKNENEANEILNKLSNSFTIDNVDTKEKKKASPLPFKTSTLQRLASTKYGFNASKTMKIAQKLYEGIDLGQETVGLITYMRTDSTRLSPTFIDETKNYIKNKYGEEYIGYVKKGKKDENIQDAHEGIRVTSINRNPESIKAYLSLDEYKLYKLIYARSLAALMADAKVNTTSIELDNNGYTFKATGSILVFDGYLNIYKEYEVVEDVILPDFSKYKSNVLISSKIEKSQHFTKPPARYNEASLIKEMESLGIGRPSTYAKTMDTLKQREYVTIEDKKFIPTEIGFEITDKLQEAFSNIINVEYTAKMEQDLDDIAEDKVNNVELLSNFYKEFEPLVEESLKTMAKKEPEKTGENCPKCGSPMVKRKSSYGQFEGCSNYPKCKYIKPMEIERKIIMKCPLCSDGDVIEKVTKKKKVFYGCSNYPKCGFASWDLPIEEKCPKCNGTLTIKKNQKKCLNCDYIDK